MIKVKTVKPKGKKLSNSKASSAKANGRFVLFVGDDGAVLIYYENKQVLRRIFASSHEDKSAKALIDLMIEFPDAPIYVLVDLLDQAYVRHTLPPVTSLGVNKIIQRRLSRDFAATDLKGAISLGRDKNGRKDWNFLLISLGYGSKLKGWLDLLYDLPNRLKGIYLAPVEAEMILQSIKMAQAKLSIPANDQAKKDKIKLKVGKPDKNIQNASSKWDILVLHNKTGGFRQVVIKDKQMVFTRMAQCEADEKPSIMAGNIEQEVKNTIEYLKRLSFTQGSELNILIIIGEEIKANISQDVFNSKSTIVLTPHEAAELLKLGDAILSGDRFADILISCAFLLQKKHRLRLVSETAKKLDKLYQIKQAVKISALLVILGLIIYAGYAGYQGLMLKESLKDKKVQVNSMQSRFNNFKQQTVNFEVDPAKIDALTKIRDIIYADFVDYRDLIPAIVQNINRSITVKNFTWNNIGSDTTNQTAPVVAPINGAIIPNGFEAKIDWEIIIQPDDKLQPQQIWEELVKNLTAALPNYKIINEGIAGEKAGEDKLTINFDQKAQLTAIAQTQKQRLIASMKIFKTNSPNNPLQPTQP